MSRLNPDDIDQTDQARSQSSSPAHPPRSVAEWVSFSIASAILATIVGLVTYTWLDRQQQQPPTLAVKQDEVRETDGQFYVSFEVTNTGGATAESVQVLAELRVDGEVEETGEQQIDFLSGGEKERGAFIFTRNPQQGTLTLRVASYKLP